MRTIIIPEHFDGTYEISLPERELFLEDKTIHREFAQNRAIQDAYTAKRTYNGIDIKTSYFIGIDWLIENKLAIKVETKINNNNNEVDYVGMLHYVISSANNADYLPNLIHFDFTKPRIPIDKKDDNLSIFIIMEFLDTLKKIVRKGLKKSYYQRTENLNSKIKGKLLAVDNLIKNHTKGDYLHNYCRYSEYGIDCDENRFLKYTLRFVLHIIENELYDNELCSTLKMSIRYIMPFFQMVSDETDVRKVKRFKPNALYKEYSLAINLAKDILQRHSYNFTNSKTEKCSTPPYWIDMSRLFELYVYNKLKECVGEENIIYHKTYTHKQEPDYLMKSSTGRSAYIIDAKYKPRYEDSNNDIMRDIRQIAGYSRIINIYKELAIDDLHRNIPCIIIHPSFNADANLSISKDGDIQSHPVNGFTDFYKIGIKLPFIKSDDDGK